MQKSHLRIPSRASQRTFFPFHKSISPISHSLPIKYLNVWSVQHWIRFFQLLHENAMHLILSHSLSRLEPFIPNREPPISNSNSYILVTSPSPNPDILFPSKAPVRETQKPIALFNHLETNCPFHKKVQLQASNQQKKPESQAPVSANAQGRQPTI